MSMVSKLQLHDVTNLLEKLGCTISKRIKNKFVLA